ncbi:MAG TPA: calcium-binding protein [Aquabacterium sp.]|uniref:calcium-binding protein n=1 Tax=Aquabacterium sp. TaxID=1872578 RepID=UPI002E361BCD|nr:calcium-binding protein [Aquabacterium sp.]HEX5356706.1 calcium-binding protein [Aquabacterium sp.]
MANNVYGGPGNDYLVGTSGQDVIIGYSGDDTLIGGGGNDILWGSYGKNLLIGGDGDDWYNLLNSDENVIVEEAGQGVDKVTSYSAMYFLGANLENLSMSGSVPSVGIGNSLNNDIRIYTAGGSLWGEAGNDTLKGNTAADALNGGEGSDRLSGGGGDDFLQGDAMYGTPTLLNSGADTLYGDAGNDTLNGQGDLDSLFGGEGNDYYIDDDAGDVIVEIAGQGTDTLATSASYVELQANVENLALASPEWHIAIGNELNNLVDDGAGDGVVSAEQGSDTVRAGAGDDVILGGDGSDRLEGAAGNDQLEGDSSFLFGDMLSPGSDTLVGGAGNDVLLGQAGDDSLFGDAESAGQASISGSDSYDGGAGNDVLFDSSTTSADSYSWGQGQGNDTVTDLGGSADSLAISGQLTRGNVWLTHVANTQDLRVNLIGSTDSVVVKGFFATTSGQAAGAGAVESLTLANGNVLMTGSVACQQLIQAMSSMAPPAAVTSTPLAINTLIANAWA